MKCAQSAGTSNLLTELALGKVRDCPFVEEDISNLRQEIIDGLSSKGLNLLRQAGDRRDVPVDFRLLQLLLTAAEDPERGLGNFALGVRALYPRKKRWRLPEQAGPMEYLARCTDEAQWRSNYSSLAVLADEVEEVLRDQSTRGQVLQLSEEEARARYPNLVVASLGAQRKEKPGKAVTARVLFDGTNGIHVNRKTRIRDQERAPIAADLKRVMREKARRGERTFALTADVTEAHRHIPIAPCDWHLLGCQVREGGTVFVNTMGTFGVASASYYWSRAASALARLTQYCAAHSATTWHMLVADDFHLEAGGG